MRLGRPIIPGQLIAALQAAGLWGTQPQPVGLG
jgi:hypothetical protein